MDLDRGAAHGDDGIPQGQAVVGQGARVDDHPVGGLGFPVEEIDELALRVALEGEQFDPGQGSLGPEAGVDLGQGCRPVDVGFPLPQEVKVWAVDDEDF